MRVACPKRKNNCDDNGGNEIPPGDIFNYDGLPITTPADFQRIGTNMEYPAGSGKIWNMNAVYSQMNDIDLTGTNIGGLGTSSYQFQGAYYGNGFKIKGFKTPTIGTLYYGLFNYATNAQFINMVMESPAPAVASGQFSGSIVAHAVGCELIGCRLIGTVTGTVTGTMTSVVLFGGLVGDAYLCQIIGCCNEATISISGPYVQVGGLASQTNNTIINRCYNSGDITVTAIAGTGTNTVGGISGFITTGGTMSHITNCYNTGNIKAIRTMSGNQAYVSGIARGSNLIMITNCYNTGNITWQLIGTTVPVQYGGITASGTASSSMPDSMLHCVLLKGTINLDVMGAGRFGWQNIVATDMEMKPTLANARAGKSVYYATATSVFAGWDFYRIWNIDTAINNGYPFLIGV